MGELHLEVVKERLKREYGIEVYTGEAYVAYREGLVADSRLETTFIYDKIIGGKPNFAKLELHIVNNNNSDGSSANKNLRDGDSDMDLEGGGGGKERIVDITYEEDLEELLPSEELFT